MNEADLDVVVVGAGLSGIGAAHRLKTMSPGKRFAVLEARDGVGGTWDLFRYPGVRSDSDMFTLGYPFRPWKDARTVADGASIREYVRETSTALGIDPHLRFRHRVTHASWSSGEALWTLRVEVGEARRPEHLRCRFLYLCSGYYSYEEAHAPAFPGTERFSGRIVHPQWWPEDLDYEGRRVVVVGSGATAVTLVPALAERAAHVTLLQRSPSYLLSLPAHDPLAGLARAVLPEQAAHRLLRWRNVLLGLGLYVFSRRFPKRARRLLLRQVERHLPGDVPLEPHFSPSYAPWDQRLCIVPDADLFRALRAHRASVVTDTIESFTERGLRLTSGQELEADVVVTATGLKLQPLGGIRLEIDGRAVEPKEAVLYKGLMLAGVPNLAWCIGYVNASWTLRADLSSRFVCRLLNHMDRHGHEIAVPRPEKAAEQQRRPILELSAGYVLRAADVLPEQGARWPWRLRQNYVIDLASMVLGRVDEPSMAFSRRLSSSAPAARPPRARAPRAPC